MLSPIVTETVEHAKSAFINFAVVAAVGAFCALLLAQFFGKSSAQRQVIFSIASFLGLCVAAYVTVSKLSA